MFLFDKSVELCVIAIGVNRIQISATVISVSNKGTHSNPNSYSSPILPHLYVLQGALINFLGCCCKLYSNQ